MAKFILIDSNIAGDGGHYLEYAEQILEIAGQRGFECILAASKAFEGGREREIAYSSHSIFLHDMWGRNLSRRRRIPNEFTADDRRYLRDYYSIAGLLWNASGVVSSTRHYSQQTTLPSHMARRLGQVYAMRTKVEALAGANDQLEQADSEAEDRALRYRRFRKALAESAYGPVSTNVEDSVLAEMLRRSRATDGYGAAIARLLAELDVGVDDHIFVPTLSLADARSIRDIMRRDERARKPRWSLLFRRDVYDGYSAGWSKQDWAVHEARNLFASFLPLTQSVRLSFFTDTEPLTKQYDRLGSVPFRTTAIPVRSTGRAIDTQHTNAPWQVLVLTPIGSSASLSTFAEMIESLTQTDLDCLHFLVPTDAFDRGSGTDRSTTGNASARARLRPFLPDAVTIGGSAQKLEEMLANVDACIVIDPDPKTSPLFAVSPDRLFNMPVLAPPAVAQRLRTKFGAKVFGYSSTKDAAGSLVKALQRLVAEPQRSRHKDNRLTIGYLGDARAEKCFHLLPEIMDGLDTSRNDGQRFHLDTQIYHPNPESDIRMLRAMERIRRMPADRVSIEEGALDSTKYQAIIARSDVIFNVYARHNYVSRSSGIFVEALASLKPVLTMAGTWMSALMGEWSQAYHDQALRRSIALREKTFARVGDWGFLGDTRLVQSSTGAVLELKPGVSACSSQPVPGSANHVRVEVCTGSPFSDAPLNIIVAWQNADQVTTLEWHRQLNRTTPGVISSVFPVPKDARYLWIGLSIAGYVESCRIEWTKLTWHATDNSVAEMPGGIAVADGVDANLVKNSIEALRAIWLSYPAYADSCAWVFDRWCKDQNAGSLLNDLIDTPPALSRKNSRFVGREW